VKSTANKCLISSLVLCFALTSIVIPIAGCGKVQQTLKTVLAKAPTVIAIVNTGLDLYNIIDPTGADPGLKNTIDSAAQSAVGNINLLVQIISQYQADVTSAPPGVLNQAHSLYLAIDANLAQLQSAFHLKSAKAQAESAAIVDAVDLFLSELASLLPAGSVTTTPGAATPQTQAVIVGKKVKIQSPQQFAKNFNKASAANFPQIQVAVP